MASIPAPPGPELPGHPEHHLDVISDLVALMKHWTFAQSDSTCPEVPDTALRGLGRVCTVIEQHLQAVRTRL